MQNPCRSTAPPVMLYPLWYPSILSSISWTELSLFSPKCVFRGKINGFLPLNIINSDSYALRLL